MTLAMFGAFVALTLGITYWASRRTQTAKDFYAAGRSISGVQNGIAIAGDYMSAASFLGIAGMISSFGYDGFMYSVGWLVAYLTVLLIVAEPLRNCGKFTMADVLAYRLAHKSVRSVAALSTLTVSLFYMIAQMVGAGALVSLLIPQLSAELAIVLVGALMIVYVVFGGMLATTWVQIVKAVLLMTGTVILSVLVLAQFRFSPLAFFDAVAQITGTVKSADGAIVTKNFMQPGLKYHGAYGALDLVSLGMALIFGTAGLPHILMRFYTVPTAKAARTSVVWAMIIIGSFYILTTFLGFGAATLVGKANIGVEKTGAAAEAFIAANPDKAEALKQQLAEVGYVLVPNSNLAAPLLAKKLGGEVFLAFIAAVAFATILAVVAGLTIAASSAFAHDLWLMVIKRGKEDEREQVLVARITAVIVGGLAIVLGIALKSLNVAFLVGLAFAVAASSNVPAIVLSLVWRRFNATGTGVGMLTGLISSLVLIAMSPAVMGLEAPTATVRHLIQAAPLFPLENPGLVSIPLGFLGAIVGTLLKRDLVAEARFSEVIVRANTGLGAEV